MDNFQPIKGQALCKAIHVPNIQSNIIVSPHDDFGEVNKDFDSRQNWLSFKIIKLPLNYKGLLKENDTVLVNKHYTLKELERYHLIYTDLIEFKVVFDENAQSPHPNPSNQAQDDLRVPHDKSHAFSKKLLSSLTARRSSSFPSSSLQ